MQRSGTRVLRPACTDSSWREIGEINSLREVFVRFCVWVPALCWALSLSWAVGSRADDVSFSDAPLQRVSALIGDSSIVMPLMGDSDELPLVRFDTKAVYPVDLDVLIQLQVAQLAFEGIRPAWVSYESSFEFELGDESDPLAPLLDRANDPLEALHDPLRMTESPRIDGL